MPPPSNLRLPSEPDLLEPIRDVSNAVMHLLGPPVVAAGLAPSTFWHLHHLERGHERHPSDLARRLGVTPAACTSAVDHLVDHGYVVRRASAADRRQILLEVTPKGRRTLDAIWRQFDASLREVLAGVPARDLAITARTLREISDRLRTPTVRPLAEAVA